MCIGAFPFSLEAGGNVRKQQFPHQQLSKDISPPIWLVITHCWEWHPGDRPAVSALLGSVEDSSAPLPFVAIQGLHAWLWRSSRGRVTLAFFFFDRRVIPFRAFSDV